MRAAIPLGFSRPFAFRKGARKMSMSAQLADNYAGLLNGEERTQLESLRNSCVYALNPTNIVEVALFDLLVLTAWKIERTNRLEAVANPLPIENSAERTQIRHPLQPNLRQPRRQNRSK